MGTNAGNRHWKFVVDLACKVALAAVAGNALAQQTVSFTSNGAITIPATGNSAQYPTSPLASCANAACINVTGMTGAVQNVSLTFNSWNNTGTASSAANLGMLLQSPSSGTSGISALELLSNACKTAGVSSFTLTDAGTSSASQNGSGACFGVGNWKPTTHHFTGFVLDNFSAPGPGTTYQRAEPDSLPNPTPGSTADVSNGNGTFAAAFGGMASANGVWRLYVNSVGGTSGSIGSWTITITAGGAVPPPALTSVVSRKLHGAAPFNLPLWAVADKGLTNANPTIALPPT